jgi:hypothetical protein
MIQARNPGAWTWLTQLEPSQPESDHAVSRSIEPRVEEQELPPGVFLATSPRQESGASKLPEIAPFQRGSEAIPAQPDPSLFNDVRDVTRAIPVRAYFELLDLARRTPDDVLDQQARADLTFAQFAAKPDEYRGTLVRLRGHVRRMTVIQAPANAHGFQELYEGWLFTEESQDNPYVIVVSRLPDGFPRGGNVLEEISFTGYFLKLWSYRSGDGNRYAPLLLGSRVVWHPRQSRARPPAALHVIMFGAVFALAILLVAVSWWSRRRSLAIREKYHVPNQVSPREVQSIGEQAALPTSEYLAEMERDANRDPE